MNQDKDIMPARCTLCDARSCECFGPGKPTYDFSLENIRRILLEALDEKAMTRQ
jgi:hypothetical protein